MVAPLLEGMPLTKTTEQTIEQYESWLVKTWTRLIAPY
ncbi:hypothetical protein C8D87_1011648 [Lentzea atacamensis]|uniref:Uncharacterized protein n=1 Tax=Lentzea atacamensis TaxID=531938 RepID=A0ABX9EJG9_9PSEU|nr:hypothetical protein C8D87_1011648 [Lentzea atacamensis]